MKIAHIDTDNKLLGWYDSDIHSNIPTPNIQVTDNQWQNAIDNGHNKINKDGTSEIFDFRSESEILEQLKIDISSSIQNMLDKKAQELRYDNINSIAKYIGYDNPFREECEKLGAWSANCWVKAGEIEALGEIITVEEILAEMPLYE